jgi:Phasin protein
MSSSKQRLASATATRLAAITDMAANLEAQLRELNRLRDQLRKAQLSARGFTNDRRTLHEISVNEQYWPAKQPCTAACWLNHRPAVGSRSEIWCFWIAAASNNDQGKELPMTDMTVVHDKMKAIATAHADYVKSSFEANKAYLEKLATIKTPDQAMQITTDHMKSAYETFVAESTKIGDMYKDFFKSAYAPMTVGEPMTVGTPKLAA